MTKRAKRNRAVDRITIPVTPWDMGAAGPANRIGLVTEERGEINPATGKRENPNGVRGVRRETWAWRYLRAGKLSQEQWIAAAQLRDASEGLVAVDPLAAILIDRRLPGDPQAARVDGRARYRAMMAVAPKASHPVIERVVIADLAVWSRGGREMDRHLDRLREGLDAIHAVFFAGRK